MGVLGRKAGPTGRATRGTTAPNRLRRVDRWLCRVHDHRLRHGGDPLVVDLGSGNSPVTVVELARRVRGVRPDADVDTDAHADVDTDAHADVDTDAHADVVGVDPARVNAAGCARSRRSASLSAASSSAR